MPAQSRWCSHIRSRDSGPSEKLAPESPSGSLMLLRGRGAEKQRART